MILMANSVQDVNPYLYKLILAITVSNLGLDVEARSMEDKTVFDHLMTKSMPYFEQVFRLDNKRNPESVAEIFDHYIMKMFPRRYKEINLKFSEDLFRIPLGGIMRCLLLTPNMDVLLYKFLLQFVRVNSVGRADWYEIKNLLVDYCVSSVPLEEKVYGFGSNLQSILRMATENFVHNFSKQVFSIINKTGMNSVINEDGFTMGHLNTVSVSERKSEIDLERVLVDIHKLNTALYDHYFTGTGERIMFYDAISKYKYDLLKIKAVEINDLYKWYLKTPQGAIAIDKNQSSSETMNSGTNLKRHHNDQLLDVLKPIVNEGLHPSAVDEYARQIFLHVQSKITGSASSVFRISPKENTAEGYYGSTYVFRGPQDQEIMQDLIAGAVAINKLLNYIGERGLSIFDLDSRMFRDFIYTYRFKTIEECLDLFPTVYDLVNRKDSPEELVDAENNVLPHNDAVVSDIKKRSVSMDLSINCADITKSLGELSSLDNNKRAKAKTQSVSAIIHQRLSDAGRKVKDGVSAALSYQRGFGNMSIPFTRFAMNISKDMTFVEAMDLQIFKDNGITAPLAVESADVAYYPTPSLELGDYCANSPKMEEFVSVFIDRGVDSSKDMPLQVYRNSAFFIALVNEMNGLYHAIYDIVVDYNNNRSNKYLGVFDMFNFCSKYLLFCSIGSMNSIDAVKAIRNELNFNIYQTKSISMETIDTQLVLGYNMFLMFFREALVALKEIAATYYYDFSNRLNGSNSLMCNEALMKQIAEKLASEARVNLEDFVKFKSFCDKNSAGFLIRRGKFIFRPDKGYLMDKGYWVLLLPNGECRFDMVTAHDNFSKVVEVMV